MTRGRAMLGVGPGALTSDAYMLGIPSPKQRPRMEESLSAIMALLRAEEPVSMETEWFTLKEARLQLASYSDPHLPVAVAASFSPAGPTAAGRHGIGILSVASHLPGGMEVMQRTWRWVEESAAAAGRPAPDRADWRVVMPVHLAESKEQAMAEVRQGQIHYAKTYFEETMGRPFGPAEDLLEKTMERGGAIIGTPDEAVAAIERIVELSGGFGGFMGLAHEWATREQCFRSYELWARYVMPHFQSQYDTIVDNRNWVAANKDTIFAENKTAISNAFTNAGIEMPEDVANHYQIRRPGQF
jgi:limonene 1,2-monooxygenase